MMNYNMVFFKVFLVLFFLSHGLLAQRNSIKEVKEFLNPTTTFFDKLQTVDVPLLYDNGILFTYYGEIEERVYVSGDFNEWREKIPMQKNSKGIFYYFLTTPLEKGEYIYRFWVNGIWVNDQEQPFFKIDIHNQRVSYFRLPRDIVLTAPVSPEPLKNGRYRFYFKDENFKEVSLITEFNNWEPGFTPMTLNNGYWYVDYYWGPKKLLYAYWVDGEKKFDPYNLSRTLTSFNLPVNFYIPRN